MVKLHTNFGVITLELEAEKAPKTVENFLRYAEEGQFTDTIFHRVIPGFMIQGGGMLSDMSQKPTHEPIENEADNDLPNDIGTIAMARTNDPHSASSQFFINVSDNAFLNHSGKNSQGWGYCVFGKVTDGMDVVNEIAGVVTGIRSGHQDVPEEDVVIEKVEIEA